MAATNQREVSADILTEFLEVAVHCVLYCRGLYPLGVFGRKKKYNVPVQVCLHPEVAQYISSICQSVRLFLLQDAVQRVDVVLITKDSKPLERFVFDISQTSSDTRGNIRDDQFLFDLERSLRALLLKLNVSDSMLQPLPSDCSWTLHVHSKESATAALEDTLMNSEFPWIEAEENEQMMADPQIVPLKSLNSHLFKIQLYAEESGKKHNL